MINTAIAVGLPFGQLTLAQRAINILKSAGPGAWYDPSDLTTLYQDSAGTTPVTAVEQPVGRVLDKSGRGNHLIQPTATSRPTLRQDGNGMYHLAFDGIDDSLYTAASVDFTTTDKMTVFAGVHKASDVATAALVELSANALSTNGAFVLGAPFGTGTATYDQYVRGTAVSGVAIGSTPAPTTNVITAVGDIAGDLNRVTKNGTTSNQIGGDLGTGNFGNYPLYVGRRNNASLPFNGRIYQLAIKGKAMTAAEISTLESYINSKTKAF